MVEICQEEFMIEILRWLLVRSLFRFKCVSKSWNIILSDPYFKAKHQNHHANSLKFLLLHNVFNRNGSFHNLYSLSSPDNNDDIQKLDDDIPSNRDPYASLLFGYCDGLVLIGVPSGSIDQLFLWNPTTRESILLPRPPFGIFYSTFGLGYDQTTNDYVVLTIHNDRTYETHPHYGILALKSGSWRKICTNIPQLFCPSMDRFGFFMDYLTFIHGAFHWIGCCSFVVSLNISNEAHTEIPLPEQIYDYPSDVIMKECGVSVLKGMLCVSSTRRMMIGGEDTFMLWAMKEYGVKESWTQLFKIKFTIFNSEKVIYRFADGEVLFHLSNKTSKGAVTSWFDWFDSLSIGHDDNTFEVITFTESLISPKSLI